MSKQLVAVYGTLKQGYNNNRLLSDAKFIGTGKTRSNYSMLCYGVPMVFKKNPIAPVFVEIYEVTESCLTGPLDRLEGHPNFYCREKVYITFDDNISKKCWLYFGKDAIRYGKEVKPDSTGVINWSSPWRKVKEEAPLS